MLEEKKQQFITKQGYEDLVSELHNLKEEKLPKVQNRLKEAIKLGDLSENSEYAEAQSEKGLTEKRIEEIEKLLDNIQIVEKTEGKNATVGYGSTVTFESLEDNKQYTVTIVGTGEVDIQKMHISFQSPIGFALKGKKAGQKVKARVGDGRQELKVIEVR